MVKKYESPWMKTVEIKQNLVLMAGSNGKCGVADYDDKPIPTCPSYSCSNDGCEEDVW